MADAHVPDLLRMAGYSSGDFVPLLTFGGQGASASTSSSTYGDVLVSQMDISLTWDTMQFTGKSIAVLITGRAQPSTDQVDVRLRNKNLNETPAEKTGLTSDGEIGAGPTVYTASTTSTRSSYRLQIKNGDNTTSVSVQDVSVVFGVQL